MLIKSGVMLGLGESVDETIETMSDLREAGCNILTLGQYLQPAANRLRVERFYTLEEFASFKRIGLEMGFGYVEAGPLVRSSYHAHEHKPQDVIPVDRSHRAVTSPRGRELPVLNPEAG